MDEKLIKFLRVVPSANWRQSPPSVWNEQLREALNDGLINHAFGGLLQLTDAGRAALAEQKDRTNG